MGFLGIGGMLVALIHHLPYARRLSRTHELAKAQRADGKMDIWYGSIPYGRIFLGSGIYLVVSLCVLMIVILFFDQHLVYFLLGIASAGILKLIGLYDPRGRFKRDFNLMFGDNYFSDAFQVKFIGTLQDEQRLRDLPPDVYNSRKFLLSNEGKHEDTPKVKEAITKIFEFDKPILMKQEQFKMGFSFIIYELPKVLASYSLIEEENVKVSHSFDSLVGSLEEDNSVPVRSSS
ncbi:hypothetical protein ACFLSV_07695 [Bacteroidota bacterium]